MIDDDDLARPCTHGGHVTSCDACFNEYLAFEAITQPEENNDE